MFLMDADGYVGGEEEDVCGEEDVSELDENELKTIVKDSYNKLQNELSEFRAPQGKFKLIEVDLVKKTAGSNYMVAYSTIGIFQTCEEAKHAAQERGRSNNASYKVFDDSGKCVSEIN